MWTFDIDSTSSLGCVITGPEGHPTYIPYDFTHVDFRFSSRLLAKATHATGLLGRLDGHICRLENAEQFVPMFIRMEALWSSRLSGIKSNQVDDLIRLLRRRGGEQDEMDSISSLIKALDGGLKALQTGAVSNELICRLHRLLTKDDSATFRAHQNWLGGDGVHTASFVPPPPYEVHPAMNELERFLSRSDDILPLLKIGLAYAQFETIRPFMSWNSRIGRLLLCFYMAAARLLHQPFLYLSHYFHSERRAYYAGLHSYRCGDYETWLLFFLDGVLAAGDNSLRLVDGLDHIRREDSACMNRLTKTAAYHGRHLLSHLFQLPVTDVTQVMQRLSVSRPAAQAIIDRLIKLGILHNRDESLKYARSYVYRRYLAVFG